MKSGGKAVVSGYSSWARRAGTWGYRLYEAGENIHRPPPADEHHHHKNPANGHPNPNLGSPTCRISSNTVEDERRARGPERRVQLDADAAALAATSRPAHSTSCGRGEPRSSFANN